MATTPTQPPAPPRGWQRLYICRRCTFTTTSPAEVSKHWDEKRHPCEARILPPVKLPASPPLTETLEDKLNIALGLLEHLAKVSEELAEALEQDDRTHGTGPVDDVEEMELHVLTWRNELQELRQQLALIGPRAKEVSHA